MAHILVVDDEVNIRNGLAKYLKMQGHTISLAWDGEMAIQEALVNIPDLILLDLKLPKLSGHKVAERLLDIRPHLSIIILTGHGTIEEAVDLVKKGVFDFFTKPLDLKKLTVSIQNAEKNRKLLTENNVLRSRIGQAPRFQGIIGQSSPILHVIEMIKKVAHTKATVLIEGESGTGKELVAQAIYYYSDRKDESFIPINCSSFNTNLIESELFGHEKGAFTGATELKRGKFELAQGGVLFLDEIGELNQEIQVKLLRILEEGKMQRVGGTQVIDLNIRLISATNKSLETLVKEGVFRQDLYYRLNVFKILVPPLRERKEDIVLLSKNFLNSFAQENNLGTIEISNEVLSVFLEYSWPGNVRELKNILESASILCFNNKIEIKDIPFHLQAEKKMQNSDEFTITIGESLKMIEDQYIKAVLTKVKGNKLQASKILGIGRKALYDRLKKMT